MRPIIYNILLGILALAIISLTAFAGYAEDSIELAVSSTDTVLLIDTPQFPDASNTTSETNTTINVTNSSILNNSNVATNLTTTVNNSNTNISATVNNTNTTTNTTTPSASEPLTIVSIVPAQFKLGDAQLNILVQNNGQSELDDIDALVTGKGFATYDVVPIDSLKPGEKSYILIMCSFSIPGEIQLSIKIDGKTFYRNVTVISNKENNESSNSSPNSAPTILTADEYEESLMNQLILLKESLNTLKQNYDHLQREYDEKKSDNYDVSQVSFTDLKKFLRDAESSIIHKDAEQANVSITLASNEYEDQKDELLSAKKIKISFKNLLKDNAVLISTIAGAVIAFFSLIELLKKKKDSIYQTIAEMKVDKNTKIVVEKKSKKNNILP